MGLSEAKCHEVATMEHVPCVSHLKFFTRFFAKIWEVKMEDIDEILKEFEFNQAPGKQSFVECKNENCKAEYKTVAVGELISHYNQYHTG